MAQEQLIISVGATTSGVNVTVTPTVTTTYQLWVAGSQYGDNQFATVTVNVNRLSLYRTPVSTAIETGGEHGSCLTCIWVWSNLNFL